MIRSAAVIGLGYVGLPTAAVFADAGLDIADNNLWMLHHLMCDRNPPFQRCGANGFQWIPRRDQPPHPIQTKPPQSVSSDMDMPKMGRIERPPQ